MGTQCKSATLPDAVNPFLGRPIVSLDSKTHEFADVWEDRVGEDKSEDLPFIIFFHRMPRRWVRHEHKKQL